MTKISEKNIEVYKILVNNMLSLVAQSQGIISESDFKNAVKDIEKPDGKDGLINNIYKELMCYDKANSDDKLRMIYNKLDELDAETELKDSENIKGSLEELPEDSEIDKARDYFKNKSFNDEDIAVIEKLSDYTNFVSTLNFDYLSRGQKDYSWPLMPSALRKDKKGNNLYSEDDVSWMIEEFKRVLKYYDKSYSNKNKNELLSYAQHYAIPTNLIDFTEAHMLSLLFALQDYESEDTSVVYFVDAMKYNSEVCFKGKRKPIPNCSDEGCDAGAASIFIKSDSVNERIHFQKGYFLKIPDNYAKKDLLEDLRKYTKIAIIAHQNKERILTELFSLGITFQNIYPDLNNLASSIKFMSKIKQRSNLDD